MNVVPTRATDNFPRRAFSVDEVRRMIDAGVIAEDERFELIEGDLVMMASKSVAHDKVQSAITLAIARALPDGWYIGNGSTLQLAEGILVEPDIAVTGRSLYDADPQSFARPTPNDIMLLIEIAVSSLAYDRNVKARLYARHGIREYWVIDALARTTFVHLDPQGEEWATVVERGPQDMLTIAALPGFAMRLADIG